MQYRKSGKRITDRLVEHIAFQSDNTAFKSIRFRKAIISFRRFGLRPRKKATWNLHDILYFARNSYNLHQVIEKCTE